MAAANRRRKRANGDDDKGLPGWAMLTIGLIIGLFVAFLVYLDDIEPMEDPDLAIEHPDELADADEEEERPRFEFYSILPELEVVLPDPRDDEPEVEEGVDPAPEVVEPEPEAGEPAAPAPDADHNFYLQVGSFQDPEPAESLVAEVTLLGLDVQVRSVEVNDEDWYRVHVGPFTDEGELEAAQERLQDNGIDSLVLRGER